MRGRLKRNRTVALFTICCTTVAIFVLSKWHSNPWEHNVREDISFEHMLMETMKNACRVSAIQGSSSQLPLILLGTTHFGKPDLWIEYTGFRELQKGLCPYNCEISTNVDCFPEADLVVVSPFPVDSPSLGKLLELPRSKEQIRHQKWAVYNIESPSTLGDVGEELAKRLNWTITYRRDSNVSIRYGRPIRRHRIPATDDDITNAIQMKTKPVAAVISNFVHHRQEFIQELREHIQVDVFGKVTGVPCPGDTPKNHDHWLCRQNVAKNYWFYLAIENANCKDYVTEKFFDQLPHFIVPITVAGDWDSNWAPPNSFIRYNDTEGVEVLAEKLKYLMENPNEYRKFFDWKKTPDPEGSDIHPLCLACEGLHEPGLIRDQEFKDKMEYDQWWRTEADCRPEFNSRPANIII